MTEADTVSALLVSLSVDELSMRQLRALVGLFDIGETSLRSTLSRLHARSMIEVRKQGRGAFCRLGGGGIAVGRNVSRHFHEPDWTGWDGRYWEVAFSYSDDRGQYRM